MGRSCRNIARGVSLPIRYLGAPWPASVGSTVRRSRLNCLLRSGMFFFVGPVLLLFSMVAEWIMGNFFPMMAMGLYAVFWLSFGMLQLPTLQLGQSYATEADPTGVMAPEFNATIGIYLVVWGFALFTFFLFTLKINLTFAMIFAAATSAVWTLSGAYFKLSLGEYAAAATLQKVRIA